MSAGATTLRQDARVIGLVGVGHAISHFYQLMLPPLFPLMKDDLGVSYAALGFVLAVYFTVSGVFQFLAGFAVDRYGARRVLAIGLVLCVLGALLAGLSRSYEALLAAAVIGGLGNSVFHPADLAILNARVNTSRLGYAFSWHGVAGFAGYAIAPGFAIGAAAAFGWHNALVLAAATGAAFLVVLYFLREDLYVEPAPRRQAGGQGMVQDLGMLMSKPVLMCFFYFVLASVAFIAMQGFGVTALVSLFDMPVAMASAALSLFFFASAVGILAGGYVATKSSRHNVVAATGVSLAASLILTVALVPMPVALVPLMMAAAGFCTGITNPSRDLIVRQTTPPGSTGKVYGFVYSGIDVGSMLMPVLFGWMIDQGNPRGVLLTMAAALAITVVTVLNLPTRKISLAARP
ncbi:MAG: MFS transporter [Burkholderiales bacterium]